MSSIRWLAFTVLLALSPSLPAQEPAKLVTVRDGDCPIIVAAPHGGRLAVPNVAERKGDGVKKLVTVRDDNTDALAERLEKALEKSLGKRPFVVIARFDRKYIDANRAPKDAYEADAAKPTYDAYHAALRKASQAVQEKWGRGLLVDLHGQGADAAAIFRGTNDGKSVTLLLDRFGRSALVGPKSILGVLAKQGYSVIPANDSKDAEDKRFNGGHTVQTYGSKSGNTIDAIQLELGADLRKTKTLDRTASDLAEAISIFAREHLPLERKK
jgi:N-formylglutamate amidohydrolase